MDTGQEADSTGFAERTYQWLHAHFPQIVDCRPIDVVYWLEHTSFTVVRAQTVDVWGLPVKVCLSHRRRDDMAVTGLAARQDI
jgi:demethylmenaquinone methyltransferase/2-methoxy-6-polyprenyl-1,4-benzoquinol methylase